MKGSNNIRIRPPSKGERRRLRWMIVTGLCMMCFFIYHFFDPAFKGNTVLYAMLAVTILFFCFKTLHEWYHYYNITAPPVLKPDRLYSVDVLTTFCSGEPYEMLEGTLAAMAAISYPHENWCCDEADDPVVKDLCRKYGVRHVHRTIKKHAKAGNINHALQFSEGEICVVLDPDHVPAPDFLDTVLGYFRDPSIGFVQVVQAYSNHEENLITKGAAQQTYQFYGPMMMSMHHYGTVQAIGANCSFRRAALDSIGGHAPGLAEDMNTAMKLHGKGWKSVYVPAVITRGLVPADLHAYYKQQLKWSRGTFELLLTTYPAQFRRFSWRQKLHYFLLPFHYAGGLVVLLNLLIPSLALLLEEMPMRMDVIFFFLIASPVLVINLLIRHYVQNWVAEETERGFHLVGGLLQIGTWWIHTLGLLYTIVRKKVPYFPTPKNTSTAASLKLLAPNLLMLALNLYAIIAGLYKDWNPYTLFMAFMCWLNVCILAFVTYAALRVGPRLKKQTVLKRIKRRLWFIRHAVYAGMRRFPLPIAWTVLVLAIFGIVQQEAGRVLPEQKALPRFFYPGVFQPDRNNGITSPEDIQENEFPEGGIISFYLPWKKNTDPATDMAKLPLSSAYDRNLIPMITLEPWLEQPLASIASGNRDGILHLWAKTFRDLDKPVFLRFAHEPENNRYPWGGADSLNARLFVDAWRRIHDIFRKENAWNVVWVYNPWKPPSARSFFPGNEYVDWVGVNVLDYDVDETASFYSLYRPYHDSLVFASKLPVMISEAGTLSAKKQQWWNNAWKAMDTAFPEIKSVIAFNNNHDYYDTAGYTGKPLQWRFNTRSIFSSAAPGMKISSIKKLLALPASKKEYDTVRKNFIPYPDSIRGIVYDKAVHWLGNEYTASRKNIEEDMDSILRLGANTVLRTLNGTFDRNFMLSASAKGLHVIPMLWVNLKPENMGNQERFRRERERILQVVTKYRNNDAIKGWYFSADVNAAIDLKFHPPHNVMYKRLYMDWLEKLVREIRLLDPGKPVLARVLADQELEENLFANYLKERDIFDHYLLASGSGSNNALYKTDLPERVSWGEVPVKSWRFLSEKKSPIVRAWQEEETTGFLDMTGLLDMQGRKKQEYFLVEQWYKHGQITSAELPVFEILKPARLTVPGTELIYNAVHKTTSGKWEFANEQKHTMEWSLISTDPFGNYYSVRSVGKGAYVRIESPANPEQYRICLRIITGRGVITVIRNLNTPLIREE